MTLSTQAWWSQKSVQSKLGYRSSTRNSMRDNEPGHPGAFSVNRATTMVAIDIINFL
jgi:hypothetical protein